MVFSQEEKQQAFGFHLLLDCYQCCSEKLDNIDACYNFLNELVDRIGAIKQTQPYIFRTPGEFEGKEGLSGWVPIVESGISIHTLTESRFVSIDVYSCREFNTGEIVEFVKEFFKPMDLEQQYVLRGRKYCPSSVHQDG